MVQFLRGQWKDLREVLDHYSIMYMEGLLVVPVVMAALFYPLEVLMGVVVALLISLAAFETFEWVRYHPRRRPKHVSSFRYPL